MKTSLIKAVNRKFPDRRQDCVSARKLHTFLESSEQFGNWINRMIREYGFAPGEDYIEVQAKPNGKGRPRTEYFVTIDTAKELCMISRTPRGRQARKYYIECERRLKESERKRMMESRARLEQARADAVYPGQVLPDGRIVVGVVSRMPFSSEVCAAQ